MTENVKLWLVAVVIVLVILFIWAAIGIEG